MVIVCGSDVRLYTNDTNDDKVMTTNAMPMNTTCRYNAQLLDDLLILDKVKVKTDFLLKLIE